MVFIFWGNFIFYDRIYLIFYKKNSKRDLKFRQISGFVWFLNIIDILSNVKATEKLYDKDKQQLVFLYYIKRQMILPKKRENS